MRGGKTGRNAVGWGGMEGPRGLEAESVFYCVSADRLLI